MEGALITVLLLHCLSIIHNSATSVGIIVNRSLAISNASTTTINGICEECVCALLANPTFFSFNCFSANLTCQLHSAMDRNQPFALTVSANTSFYFVSLPTFVATASTNTCIHEITSSLKPVEYLWSFDSTFRDTSSTYNGTPIMSPLFSNSTITGYGSSLSLNASMNQSVSISQPYIPLFNRSWTFEVWIYLPNITYSIDYPIVGQYEAGTSDKYLHAIVRYKRLFLGFFNDDAYGITDLAASRWYHTAFVFDSCSRNQSVYLDGVLDNNRQANSTYQGTNGTLNIGLKFSSNGNRYFDGLIDQLSFVNGSKTSAEILRGATLTHSVSFDDNSTIDEGPLRITGSLGGSTSFVSGRKGQGLHIGNVSDSYFTVQGLVLLGRTGQAYSFSIWIKPAVQQRASIIHMSSLSNGTGWYLPIMGLLNNSRLATLSWNGTVESVTGPCIPDNSWTHAAVTYSSASGLRLYVNGSLYNASSPFSSAGSGSPNYLFVGSPRSAIILPKYSDINGQYAGMVDELRVYSRELSPSDISSLINP